MYGFPNSLCISPNEEVVHGIPKDIPLEEGDILSVDCGVYMNEKRKEKRFILVEKRTSNFKF